MQVAINKGRLRPPFDGGCVPREWE